MSKIVNRIGEENYNTFGSKMIIREYRKAIDIDVYFPEYDWMFEHTQYSNFKKGRIKCPYEPRCFGKGYLGEGEYKMSENGKNTDEFYIWYAMIQRCYDSKYQEKHPTYKGCEVEEYLLNYQHMNLIYNFLMLACLIYHKILFLFCFSLLIHKNLYNNFLITVLYY